jgi:hypothetical protein
MVRRGFTPDDVKEKQEDYHGSCQVVRLSPDVAAMNVKSVNINLNFDEALKLLVAIQSAIMNLNRYDRSTAKGKQIGLCLSLKTDKKRITVIETKLQPPHGGTD